VRVGQGGGFVAEVVEYGHEDRTNGGFIIDHEDSGGIPGARGGKGRVVGHARGIMSGNGEGWSTYSVNSRCAVESLDPKLVCG
jgi:hypothetical protein